MGSHWLLVASMFGGWGTGSTSRPFDFHSPAIRTLLNFTGWGESGTDAWDGYNGDVGFYASGSSNIGVGGNGFPSADGKGRGACASPDTNHAAHLKVRLARLFSPSSQVTRACSASWGEEPGP